MPVKMPEDKDFVVLAWPNDRLTRLYWYCVDDGDYGACLGEGPVSRKDLKKAQVDYEKGEVDDGEFVAASLAVAALKPERDETGYFWMTDRQAQKACDVANQAILGLRATRQGQEETASTLTPAVDEATARFSISDSIASVMLAPPLKEGRRYELRPTNVPVAAPAIGVFVLVDVGPAE